MITVDRSIVLKSGIWYTISSFLFKGMAFITTPIFTRLMSKTAYGEYNNIASWVSILLVLTSCEFYTSIIRSKLEFEDDIDSFIFSLQILGTIITAIFYSVCVIFGNTIFVNVFGIDKKYIHIIFLYLFLEPAFNLFITKHRAFYKYKMFSIMTGISVIITLVFSVALVAYLPDKLEGRVYGQYIPSAVLGLILYIIISVRGKKVKLKYWKYAISLCVPLVPNVLSLHILSSSDRIIINKICGPEETALYSLAYSCANIISILINSMNKAWAPWLFDTLHAKKKDDVKNVTRPYFIIFAVVSFCVIIFCPEIVYILGGTEYHESIYVLPPLIVGMTFQFVQTMYVQVEFYEKKTIWVSLGTLIAAVFNIILNFIFIPIYGFAAAAYTTLVGYVILFVYHYLYVHKLGYKNLFDENIFKIGLSLMVVSGVIMELLYNLSYVRYAIILGLIMCTFALFKKNKSKIDRIIRILLNK